MGEVIGNIGGNHISRCRKALLVVGELVDHSSKIQKDTQAHTWGNYRPIVKIWRLNGDGERRMSGVVLEMGDAARERSVLVSNYFEDFVELVA